MKAMLSLTRAFEKESVSVFESMRSYGGVIFRLEDHLERLRASAKTVGMRVGPDASRLRKIISHELKRSGKKDAFVRVTVMSASIYVTITSRAYPTEIFVKGVRVATSAIRKNSSRSFYPEAKSSSYLGQIMATFEAPKGIFEILFLGEDGMIRETRNSNIFMIKENRLLTPPLVGILEGVTRRVVMGSAEELGLQSEEAFFTRHDLFNANEIFLTNTSGEIIPVRELDGRKVGGRAPGVWTKHLMNHFRKKVDQYTKECGRVKN